MSSEHPHYSAANGVSPGFSTNKNHPSFKRAVKKARQGTKAFALVLILAPLAVCALLSIKNGDGSSLLIGGAVSLLFLVFNLVSMAKARAQKSWDGTVVDKELRTLHDNNQQGSAYYVEYVTDFRDKQGKTRKHKEGTPTNEAHPVYDYLKIGERVRYHPEFGGFYEKYDKSEETEIYCPACAAWTAISEEYCTGCGTILLK